MVIIFFRRVLGRRMLSKCCCCVPLRSGCIALGVVGILVAFIYLDPIINQSAYIFILPLLVSLCSFGTLLIGAIVNNKTMVLVHSITYAMLMVLKVIFVIVAAVAFTTLMPVLNDCEELDMTGFDDCEQYTSYTMVLFFIVSIIELLLDIYFWFCSFSFYLKLKKEDSNPV